MNILNKILITVTSLTIVSSSALAIDHVILKSGDVVEGKILSDVPHRHVDLQLINGTKKRFQQSEVASLERDVPSDQDRSMQGSSSEILTGISLGGISFTNTSAMGVKFNWGARFGINVAQLGNFSKLAFALAYNSTPATPDLGELMVQFLFRKVSNSGFYFGPELGLAFYSGATTQFNAGVVVGYDYFFTNRFSFGPEVHFTGNKLSSQLKYSLGGTLHF